MVQNDNPTPTLGNAPKEAASGLTGVMALIDKRYPEKAGRIRRIHPVFQNFYRVNFHSIEKQNEITESHFISVTPDDVTEMN
ncbi:MAG TPA: hypothetical protein VEK08_13295 [Planctomycetota bacterium]|nr:hypothetical protein [Planctomycetota bacterium]